MPIGKRITMLSNTHFLFVLMLKDLLITVFDSQFIHSNEKLLLRKKNKFEYQNTNYTYFLQTVLAPKYESHGLKHYQKQGL